VRLVIKCLIWLGLMASVACQSSPSIIDTERTPRAVSEPAERKRGGACLLPAAGWVAAAEPLAIAPWAGVAAAGGNKFVGGADLGATFEVPTNWEQPATEPIFRNLASSPVLRVLQPATSATPSLIVIHGLPSWAEQLPPECDDFVSSFANHTLPISERSVELGWATGSEYVLAFMCSSLQPCGYHTHVVLRTTAPKPDLFWMILQTSPDSYERDFADQVLIHVLQTLHPA